MSKICMGCMESHADGYSFCPYCGYVGGTGASESVHMTPGTILLERYIVGKVLGSGGFGVTYIGRDALLEQKVAIKEYLPSEFATRAPGQTHITVFSGAKQEQFQDGLDKFVEEAQRLAQFHSIEGIVKVYDSFATNNTAYIIMEFLEGETLAERLHVIQTFAPDEAISLLTPIIQSLQAVHAQGVIHRDIAPDNIFLTTDGKVKLIDFGAARFATTTFSRSLTVIIKPGYTPEEQYCSRGDQGAHTDVYAVGATLYRMIAGVAPPDAFERRASIESRKKDLLQPLSRLCKSIDRNQETAIHNALNVRIEDRTPNMMTFEEELLSETPVKPKRGSIKRTDLLTWPLWAKVAIPTCAIVVGVLSMLFMLGMIGFESKLAGGMTIPEGMCRVPAVINNNFDEAKERLADAGLQFLVIGKEYSTSIPENMIITQDINAGSVVMRDSVVHVYISSGAETVTLPDLTGMHIDAAAKTLEGLGLTVELEREYSMVFAEDAVISQFPETNSRLEIGEPITLIVSGGLDPAIQFEKKMTAVPSFVGLSFAEAQSLAQESGFVLIIQDKEYNGIFDEGLIMEQSMPGGSEFMSGSVIRLTVSLGIQTIELADYQFMQQAEARELLMEQGLQVEIIHAITENVANGLVVSQEPAPQTIVGSGEKIKLTVSMGGFGLMPDVKGVHYSIAESVLLEIGISVVLNYEYDTAIAEGTVLEQDIPPGSFVESGLSATLLVGTGQDLLTTPDVSGQTEDAARGTLTSQGFKVVVSEAFSHTAAQGCVISQLPQAGTSQPMGATIALTVSKGYEIDSASTAESEIFIAGKVYSRSLKTLQLVNEDITDITGLQYMVNLTTLELDYNEISDISPLRGLTKLQRLGLDNFSDMYGIGVSDISPLTNMVNLTSLFLQHNSISDISPLQNLRKLEDLRLSANYIEDILPIAGMTRLTKLCLAENNICDISTLSALTNLTFLDLDDNNISDVSVLSNLRRLENLYLSGNPLTQEQVDQLQKSLPECKIVFE